VVMRKWSVGKRLRSLPPDDEVPGAELHQFQCGHEECGSQLTASTRDDLMRQVAHHLKEAHLIDSVTETLLRYLESTCVTVQRP
jgi:predicted small metal-binding protein